jgi:serine/threonine protein kinase/tetratricopeptide (TPR) repeat protein
MTADSPLLWERWDDVDRLLAEALDRPALERVAFVRRAAKGDDALRDLVLRLLERLDADTGRVTSPSDPLVLGAFAAGDGGRDAGALEPGTEVDRYRVIRHLGRGGMATVYEAERSDGTYEQRVALKVLRRGLDTDDLIRRFLVERQILSSLSHPNIARLLDGGSTADGRPYLVMELVEGKPITVWADAQRLDVLARLKLFLSVADAVHAAHRQLVVHRDIKPSNVLVGADGRVKLLDFGIAKLLEEDGEETAIGARPLTPTYASPEQLVGGRITTATDVFQLGLLLRELLTGVRPPAKGTDPGDSSQRPSRTVETPLPKTPVPESRAANRSTTPVRLSRQLRGDLDIIIGKALRPEPEERYGSADEFAADVRRHLRGLPISAHPESLPYRTRKFIGRHPTFLPGVAMVLVAASLFIGMLVRHNQRLERERDIATAASQLAQQTQAFLVDLFESADPLAPADPERGRNITVVEALRIGTARVREELRSEPALQAELLSTIGAVLTKLDQTDSAYAVVGEAVAVRLRTGDTLSTAFADDLGELAYLQGSATVYDSSRQLLVRRLRVERARTPVDPEREGRTFMALAMLEREVDPVGAVALAEQGVALFRPTGSKQMGEALRLLADDYRTASRLEEAEVTAREALAIFERQDGPETVGTAMAAHTLGQVLGGRGHVAPAVELMRRAVAIFDQRLGAEHAFTMAVRNNLAVLMTAAGLHAESEGIYRDLLVAKLDKYGADNSLVAGAYQNLAVAVAAQGRYRQADSLAREAERIYRRVMPTGSYIIAFPMLTRAEILLQGGDAEGARRVAAGAADLLRGKVPVLHPAAIMADCRLGRAQAQLGDLPAARALLDSAVWRLDRAEGVREAYQTECREAQLALGLATPAPR